MFHDTGKITLFTQYASDTSPATIRAVSLYRSSPDQEDKAEAVKPLIAAYEAIKKETGKTYDPKAVAELEIKVWGLVEEGARDEIIAARIAERMALLHGGTPRQPLATAPFFAAALKETQASAGPAARQNLQKGWADLPRSARAW